MKENYDNNKEIKITRIFPSKHYMGSLLSLYHLYFSSAFAFISQEHGFY